MSNLTSLMSGGWEPDDNFDLATDYELAMEQWEDEHPAPRFEVLFRNETDESWEKLMDTNSEEVAHTYFDNGCRVLEHGVDVSWHEWEYSFATKAGVKYKFTSAKEAAAAFLYRKQKGEGPNWDVFPGRHETVDFYTLNDKSGKFFVENGEMKVAMFGDYIEASEYAKIINENTGLNYDVYQGGVNEDGFIAGPEDWDLHDPNEYKGPFTVWKYEDSEETETQIDGIFEAIYTAECCVENGGSARVKDKNDNDIPLFAEWKPLNVPSMFPETWTEFDELPF